MDLGTVITTALAVTFCVGYLGFNYFVERMGRR